MDTINCIVLRFSSSSSGKFCQFHCQRECIGRNLVMRNISFTCYWLAYNFIKRYRSCESCVIKTLFRKTKKNDYAVKPFKKMKSGFFYFNRSNYQALIFKWPNEWWRLTGVYIEHLSSGRYLEMLHNLLQSVEKFLFSHTASEAVERQLSDNLF